MTQYTEHYSENLAATPIGLTDSILRTLAQWIQERQLKRAVRLERQRLLALSDAQLRDIGIDLDAARGEARRRDIPAMRRA